MLDSATHIAVQAPTILQERVSRESGPGSAQASLPGKHFVTASFHVRDKASVCGPDAFGQPGTSMIDTDARLRIYWTAAVARCHSVSSLPISNTLSQAVVNPVCSFVCSVACTARSGAALVAVGDKVYLFGGQVSK